MHYRRKHPTGKPQYRKHFSDWAFPPLEKGSSSPARHTIAKHAASAKQQIKEYFHV